MHWGEQHAALLDLCEVSNSFFGRIYQKERCSDTMRSGRIKYPSVVPLACAALFTWQPVPLFIMEQPHGSARYGSTTEDRLFGLWKRGKNGFLVSSNHFVLNK